jgi:hypothetical protein
MKKKGYGVSGEEERRLQNNLVFSISTVTPNPLLLFPPSPLKVTSFWGQFLNYFVFSKGYFSNLTSKNDVILYFSSNLTVLTNEVVKIQLFDSLDGYFITFGTFMG